MVLLGRTDPRGKQVNLDLLAHLDLLAEGDQELQDYLEPTDCQAESDRRVQRVLKVFQDFLDLRALTDLQVFPVLFKILVVTFCVLRSALLVLLVLPGCQDSRVTPGTKETRGSLERMERRVTLAHRVHQVFQALWVCRAHVVSEVCPARWEE